MAGEIAVAGARGRGFDRNAYMWAEHGGISPFERVTDHDG
jgi:hypothetical protein